MAPSGVTCQMIMISGFDVLLWAGAVWVWHAASHRRAAGPCRLGVGLVVATQLASTLHSLSGGATPVIGWGWLLQTVFYFTLLYLLYHMAVLLSMCRR